MGTVVFTDAPLKIYLTASAEVRAERRYKQLTLAGESVSMRAILEDIQARDARDMNRPVAPLKPAEDAIEIDSSALSIEEVLAQILALTQGRFS
jgi:cytidylate kinase